VDALAPEAASPTRAHQDPIHSVFRPDSVSCIPQNFSRAPATGHACRRPDLDSFAVTLARRWSARLRSSWRHWVKPESDMSC